MTPRERIEPNFHLDEFACNCKGEFCGGYPDDINKVLVVARHAQKLRNVVSAAVGEEVWFDLGRGNSCLQHNNRIVGSKKDTSHHIYKIWPVGHGGIDVTPYIKAKASSRYWLRETLEVMAQEAYALGWRGIKKYAGHNHLDRRDVPWLVNFVPVYHIPIVRKKEEEK